MAEGYDPNNIFGEISPIFSLNTTGTTYFEISEQKSYRLGNVVYVYLLLHKISLIPESIEIDIGTCSIIPKRNTILLTFGSISNILITTSTGIIRFVDTTNTRNWYNITGSFVAQ